MINKTILSSCYGNRKETDDELCLVEPGACFSKLPVVISLRTQRYFRLSEIRLRSQVRGPPALEVAIFLCLHLKERRE